MVSVLGFGFIAWCVFVVAIVWAARGYRSPEEQSAAAYDVEG